MFHDPRPPYVLVLLSVSSRVCALGSVGWSRMGDTLSVGHVLLGAALLGLLVVAGGRVSCRRAAPADAAPLLLLCWCCSLYPLDCRVLWWLVLLVLLSRPSRPSLS